MRSLCGMILAAVGMTLASGTAAQGAVIVPVQDGSFESPVVTNEANVSPAWGMTTLSSAWAKTAGNTSWVNTYNPTNPQYPSSSSGSGGLLPGTADGQQCINVDLGGGGGGKTATVTYQGTSLGTYVAGATYSVSAAGGMRLDQKSAVYWSGSYHYPTFTVSLLARDNSTSPWTVVGTSAVTAPPDAGTFVDATYNATTAPALVGKEIGIQLYIAGSWTQGQMDNVRLSYIPEPASLGAMAAGLALAALRRRCA